MVVGQGLDTAVGVWASGLDPVPPECAGKGRKDPVSAELTAIGELININHLKM